MSYVRFSSDNYHSDVYCYKGDDGFITHVASRRIVGDVPELPSAMTSDKDEILAFLDAHERQMAFLLQAERVPIGLPSDGLMFVDEDLAGMRDTLMRLRKEGYHVPESAFQAIEDEIELNL